MESSGVEARGEPGERRWSAVVPLAVALLVPLVVFARAVQFPFVGWDDASHFYDNPLWANPLLRGWRGLFETREIGYPAPALLLSFALDRAVFGVSPAAMHAENVALHLLVVGLLYAVGRRVGLGARAAGGAALLFAVHPLVVEPVCWITGRKDLLADALLFSTALLAAGPRDGVDRAPALRWIAVTLLSVVAVLVLPRAVVAPVLIGIFVWFARPGTRPLALATRLAPALAASFAIVRLGAKLLERQVETPRTPAAFTLDVAGALALQLGHVVWPFDFAAWYCRVPGDPPTWWIVAAPFVALGVAVVLVRGTPARSAERFGLLFAAVAYAPACGIYGLRRWTCDSYFYLPLMGISIAVAAAAARRFPPRLAPVGRAAFGALVGILALLSAAGTSRWATPGSVFAGGADRYPNEPLVIAHEAMALDSDGRADAAIARYVELAERFPDYDDNFEEQYLAFLARGDRARALERMRRCLRARQFACARLYWKRLVAPGAPAPPPDERDVVADSFVMVIDSMRRANPGPELFARVHAVLLAAGLPELAARATPRAE